MTILYRIALTVAIFLLLDLYIFQAVKVMTTQRWIHIGFWVLNFLFVAWLIYIVVNFKSMTDQRSLLYNFIGAFILLLIPKILFGSILIVEDLVRAGLGIQNWISSFSSDQEVGQYIPSRRKFIAQIGLVAAAIPFVGIAHGIVLGRYKYTLHKHVLHFPDLPDAFDGLKIVQLSDIHVGSFSDAENIQGGIDMANAQEPDLILFTGDMVNNEAREMKPWLDVFKGLKAKVGKFSILGNHDYGDYIKWSTTEAKQKNMEELFSIHKELGFNLLLDQNISIERKGEKLHIAGVENWGEGFGQRGNLKKAMDGINSEDFKILLSHDPSHWEKEVKSSDHNVQLTLSGHTHGMQFGIEIPGIKWSPVKYRYRTWAGLYEELGRFIHVNRGFGFIGFPGRVGIWPEITSIILKKGERPLS